ncbi:hypothetical protein B9081_007580 [Citrobacter werkmanii]|nr:hypothetical protein B9081_007580 [Citrobacter werkmanii]
MLWKQTVTIAQTIKGHSLVRHMAIWSSLGMTRLRIRCIYWCASCGRQFVLYGRIAYWGGSPVNI